MARFGVNYWPAYSGSGKWKDFGTDEIEHGLRALAEAAAAERRLSPLEVYRREMKIVGFFSLNGTLGPALRLIRSGAVRVEPLVSHTFGLDEFEAYLRRVGRPDTMKLQALF